MSIVPRCSALLALIAGLASPAQGQDTLTVAGTVVAADGAPIEGATIRADSAIFAVSDAAGRFRLPSFPAGRHTLQVAALGYARAAIEVVLVADTSLTIVLEAAPLRLDPLTADVPFVAVSGRVTDAETRLGVDATAYVRPGTASATTNGSGRFAIARTPVVEGSVLQVEAFGYLPVDVPLTSLRDTSVDLALNRDPVAAAMISRQLERITERSSKAVTYDIESVHGDSINHAGTIPQVLRYQFGIRSAGCVALDDRIEPRGRLSEQRWAVLPSDEIQFIEIIDRGVGTGRARAGMIRIYTKNYVRGMVQRQSELPSIIFKRNANPLTCR